MTSDRLVLASMRLQQLGVSQAGTVELISQYPIEAIEAQLDWLPYRKAKRPEAFIVEAIRNSYSPPKELFYAPTQKPSASAEPLMDQGSEPAPGSAAPDSQGHRTQNPSGDPSPDFGLEQGRSDFDLVIPKADGENRPWK
jgi:hypothetical protein